LAVAGENIRSSISGAGEIWRIGNESQSAKMPIWRPLGSWRLNGALLGYNISGWLAAKSSIRERASGSAARTIRAKSAAQRKRSAKDSASLAGVSAAWYVVAIWRNGHHRRPSDIIWRRLWLAQYRFW
jgi:hypothetical protein